MTSIADTARVARGPTWARAFLVAALLGVMAAEAPGPWAVVWLAAPVLTALAMLLAWRFGRWGLVVPAVAAAGALATGVPGALWAWWIPAAALSGAWTGLREEGGRAGAGDRAWFLAPVLALAVALPWLPGYGAMRSGLDASWLEFQRWFEAEAPRHYDARQIRDAMAGMQTLSRVYREVVVPFLVPTALFAWVALLVGAGRTFASRAARVLRWPPMTRTPLTQWRVPDGVLWTFLAGLAVLVIAWAPAAPSGWTLLLSAGLGFGVQGIAVVSSLLLSRGVPTAVIALTMLFVLAVAMPVFVMTAVALGLSDAWLDHRRLEPTVDGGNP